MGISDPKDCFGSWSCRVTILINGIDIIEIYRIRDVVNKYGDRFLNRIYTTKELDYCRGRAPQLASRFAAKEAVMKALGTGTRGVSWKDIEIIRYPGNAPIVNLHSSALKRAKQIGLNHLAISLSHSKEYAVASVVGKSRFGNRLHD